ncbi:MAG: AAA-like domain-containing protein, partial [Microcystaceae cyanobacterium]
MGDYVALVFTDLVNSTAVKDEMPGYNITERNQAYRDNILFPHRKRVTESLTSYGGRIVEPPQGDGYLLEFADPVQAIKWAVFIQRSHEEDPIQTPLGVLKVKIGIHYGAPLRDGDRFIGQEVDYAARVVALAKGGQILLSNAISVLIKDARIKDVEIHSLGEYELKGIETAPIYELKGIGTMSISEVASKRRTILILSANPRGTSPLRLGEEVREIKEGLRRSKYRDLYQIETAEAVRVGDIQRAMLDYEPNIIHFCGHGGGEEGLVFEDVTGQIKLVSAEALAGLFSLFADRLDCVLLNACYSEVQAKEISRHINSVIGMSQVIGDRAAIAFAVGFYDALGADRGVDFAYKLGCNAIQMQGIPEDLTPKLLTKVSELLPPPTITTNPYVERPPIENNCYQNILKPGMLIRIKAPEKMGKSSLLNQILAYAKKQNYQTVRLDFQLLDDEVIQDSSQFLRWLCKRVSKQLQLADQVDNRWQSMTPNILCTDYFEECLLPHLNHPFVLALDNVNRLFEEKYQVVAANFFGMLRSWWGNAQQTTGSDWQKL